MTVRAAAEPDLDQMAAIWHDGWHEAHAHLLPAELTRLRTRESFRERLQAALPQVRVVGPVAMPLGLCMTKGSELYQLFVAASARGAGVAATLLADGEQRLAEAGIDVAWLACAIGNERAAKFYEKSGWNRTGTMINAVETSHGPFPVEVWRYEKRVTPPSR